MKPKRLGCILNTSNSTTNILIYLEITNNYKFTEVYELIYRLKLTLACVHSKRNLIYVVLGLLGRHISTCEALKRFGCILSTSNSATNVIINPEISKNSIYREKSLKVKI